jgi:hypothetical protein
VLARRPAPPPFTPDDYDRLVAQTNRMLDTVHGDVAVEEEDCWELVREQVLEAHHVVDPHVEQSYTDLVELDSAEKRLSPTGKAALQLAYPQVEARYREALAHAVGEHNLDDLAEQLFRSLFSQPVEDPGNR